MRELENRYGNRVDISVEDPSDLLSLWNRFRYRVRPDTPAWILGGKKTFEGVPDLDQLCSAIDAQLDKMPAAETAKIGSLG
jgi:hypothetical protein